MTLGKTSCHATIAAAALLAFFCLPFAAADAATPAQWVRAFWPTAKAAGIAEKVYDDALGDFTPDPEVLDKAATQAESHMAIWDYLAMMVSDDRITDGKAAIAKYGDSLARIEARYGVDRYVVAAIWGLESHYGAVLTNPKLVHGTIRSLATLAYSGGRLAKFGREQLVPALKILQRGDVSARAMTGSWAGAMGQTQFIPTTYNAFAVDFDGDGKRNIWTSPADALASAANYLRKSGWQPGHTWGYEVTVPATFDGKKGGTRAIGEWRKLGIARVGGKDFPREADKASLYRPGGANGPSFLLLANFRVIMRYNNATSYALAVGHLADRLRGDGPFATPWPDQEKPLSPDESQRLQALLTKRGFPPANLGDNFDIGTRAAIRKYQVATGLNPDGVPSRRLLQLLEDGK